MQMGNEKLTYRIREENKILLDIQTKYGAGN
jgi:hypothetical protein